MFGERLPEDCILEIFKFLTESEVFLLASSSKNWYIAIVARSDKIWKEKYENSSTDDTDNEGKRAIELEETYYHKYWILKSQERICRLKTPPLVRRNKSGIKTVCLSFLGDSGAGKTCLVMSYTTNSFPGDNDYLPSVLEDYNVHVMVEGEPVEVLICDSSGNIKNDSDFRKKITTAFVICFDLMNPKSLDSVKTIWAPKVNELCPSTPIILCGTKVDLRNKLDDVFLDRDAGNNDRIQEVVSTTEGEKASKEIKAYGYIEASALTQEGLKRSYDTAIKASFWNSSPEKIKERKKRFSKKGKGGCSLM